MRQPLLQRFEAKIQRNGSSCWMWIGTLGNHGYGVIGKGRRDEPVLLAHRLSYETYVGPIPDGMQLDHLCRNRRCVNPAHLQPVTRRINILRGESAPAKNARKTHCPRGHEYTPDNTFFTKTGSRLCCACGRERGHEHRSNGQAWLRAHGRVMQPAIAAMATGEMVAVVGASNERTA